ncbi:DUF1851 domain-containing protein [Pelistega sp. NLN82]|uniref:DUF1851 domain-containing protein n=1 Tax=Pelistega ratti TaxID=2652177 RepID=A0A6L9Y8P3_9BURK|nr:T6SS immunity protein Tdi1 domain-containing protein [Pelistega ratti]NEN76257.1 DUF1851 domain-containing protein [Pelistega ratti]
MEIQHLTIPHQHLEASQLLRNWTWLFEPRFEIVMITKLGDAFLIEPQSGEIFFLDTLDGELESIADSVSDFRQLLADQDFVIDYFSLELLAPLIHLEMPENTVYSFKEPPVLGGALQSDNLELFDVQVHFDDMGKLWYQVDQLAEEMDTLEKT